MKTSTYQYYGNKMVAVQDLYASIYMELVHSNRSNNNLKAIPPIIR